MITVGEEISSAKEATDILGYISRWKFEYCIEAMDGWTPGTRKEVSRLEMANLQLISFVWLWESGQVTR
jgi:hypothetical protein